MQRWEYKVVALQEGRYTEALNDYGRDGWELVSVAPNERNAPAPAAEQGGSLPMPRALGRLEDAAAKLTKLGTSDARTASAPTTSSALLWVLRRPLADDSG